jgi:Transposase IS116/IS110/IS902 family
MTAPGVGAIVGLTYASAIDDPGRFRSSKAVGAHSGLTPKRYQSGETDVTGRISKIGDGCVRTAFYEAGNVILTRPVKGCHEELGNAAGGSRRHAQGHSRARPQARRRTAPHAGRRHGILRRQSGRCGPLTRGDNRFGWIQTHHPEQGPVAGTMDQVRPMAFQQGMPLRVVRLADLFLIRPHQVAAQRRPRTEERPRRQESNSEGLTHRGP